MNGELFSLKSQYCSDFEQIWERFGNKLDKADAYTAFRQTASIRPDLPLLLLCIDEYRIRIKKTRTTQKYLAGWLRKKRWEDDMTDARYRLDHPIAPAPARPAFKASDYDTSNLVSPERAREIMQNARK